MSDVIGKVYRIHGHGFVRVVDVMGDDSSIVQAARVSYGDGTKTVRQDRELIRYLMRHRHTSPFEMCEIKLHVKCPIFVMRQWVRHRTASLNEVSGRYSELPNECFRILPDGWRLQSSKNKQGSDGKLDERIGTELSELQEVAQREARKVYEERLAKGVARELARVDLPLSQYTEFYWKIDLHNLLHFLKLRTSHHAQQEFREYATAIEAIVSAWVPEAYEAWVEYVKNAVTLSSRVWASMMSVLSTEQRYDVLRLLERSGGISKGEVREVKRLLDVA